MSAIGGSLESIALRGRPFDVVADADTNRKLGGFEGALEHNGNGTARLILTRVGWLLDSIGISIDDSLGDQEFLQELSDSKEYYSCLFIFASGSRYNGLGHITGEIQFSNASASASIKIEGPGKLTPQ